MLPAYLLLRTYLAINPQPFYSMRKIENVGLFVVGRSPECVNLLNITYFGGNTHTCFCRCFTVGKSLKLF